MVVGTSSVSASEVFQMPTGKTSLDVVEVGDPGNPPDAHGRGAVSYLQEGSFSTRRLIPMTACG